MSIKEQLFVDLLEKSKSTIYTVCYLFTNDRDEVQDLFQEILIRLWNGFDSFEKRSDWNTWVYRVAMNTALNEEKRKTRRPITLPITLEINPYDETAASDGQITELPVPKPSPFYVKECVARNLQLLRSNRVAQNIEFQCQITPDDLLVYADQSLISQVLNNLLLNAAQAIGDKPDGKIEVCAFQNDNEDVVVEISDNGAIITPELEERIFVPFFTTKKSGMGVGLSLSRQIMRLSGGTLTLRTHPQTTFVLTFGR